MTPTIEFAALGTPHPRWVVCVRINGVEWAMTFDPEQHATLQPIPLKLVPKKAA